MCRDQVGLQYIRGGEVIEVRDDEDHVFKGLGENAQEVSSPTPFTLLPCVPVLLAVLFFIFT